MEEREGNPECNHTFVYSDTLILTNPITRHMICIHCGCLRHESMGSFANTGGSGRTDPSSMFDELVKQFNRA